MFPSSDIETAIRTSGIESSYGGCGPIAMIGILDYFSRYRNYTSIMNDPTNSANRTQLAYDVFKATPTIELPKINSSRDLEIMQTFKSSGGDKNTLTLPSDYANAFNSLMTEKYHLNNQIVAHSQGWIFTSLDSKIKKIKQSIDSGLPVTVYAGLAGKGSFGNHYVNVYEYQDWQGIDRDGKVINNVIFNVRVNWGWGQSYNCYMDSTLLDGGMTGVIYYTIGDNNQLIRPVDFANDFVNDSGQGQYFFYEKTADITTSDGFSFGTSRLRCGYIENQYLVLSANRSNAGLAFLEMNFDIGIKAMNFDISLWSSREGLLTGDYIKLYYKDVNNVWQEHMTFSQYSLSTLKDHPDNFYTSFPMTTTGIKFEVYKTNPSGDRNKGRVVIGDMNLFY